MARILVAHSVEKALLELGNPAFEKVNDELLKNYNCYLFDCYEHPEYLTHILKEAYEESFPKIIQSIRKNLGEYVTHNKIEPFLNEVNI
ncbi:MAG: hypothetical protein ACE5JT_03215 [Nitrosopumilaceae archaeon]